MNEQNVVKTFNSKVIDTVGLTELAVKMIALYPKGLKPGTNYMWRDSKKVISEFLARLIKKYDCEFTEEQVLDATKRYIESFRGNYKYMQLLKYFIIKKNILTGETTSQLLSFIENTETEPGADMDWTDDLK